MDSYLLELIKEVNTIIIPGLGALTRTETGKNEILFIPYLKFDDGKLSTYISEKSGKTRQDATNLIAKYVRDIQAVLNSGEKYDIYQLGSFFKQANGQITFEQWDKKVSSEGSSLQEHSKPKTITTVPSEDQLSEDQVSIQKVYPADKTYSEEDQWNDDIDLPPINHKVERPKKPILEKAKRDRSKQKIGILAGLSILLLLIGGTLFVSIFYNSTERTMRHLKGKKETVAMEKSAPSPTQNQVKSETLKTKDKLAPTIEKSIYPNKDVTPEEDAKLPIHTTNLKKYHIIMGAFRERRNAERYVFRLNQKGATASIISRMDGLYLVAFGSYSTTIDRKPNIAVAREICPTAWLMIYP